MAEKKIQENPLPAEQPDTEDKAKGMEAKPVPDKPAEPVVSVSPPAVPRPPTSMFTKATPNDLYRRLLPAVLFVLTFVTVMTMLLIYMDTVALGAQQFRVNMSRDYELARIEAGSPALVAFVRQLHLAPRRPARPRPLPPAPPRSVRVLDTLLGHKENGTYVEVAEAGGGDAGCGWLAARGWAGLAVRAAPRDFLALRAAAPAAALHACLSPTPHPREVSYMEAESQWSAFRSRVLCLPLLTVLLAADAARADYLLLAGDNVLPALTHLPFEDERVKLQVIEYRTSDPVARNKTTELLHSKNYTVAASFDDSIMYALKQD